MASPSIRNVSTVEEWAQSVGLEVIALENWSRENFQITPQNKDEWSTIVKAALERFAGVPFAPFEQIISQYQDADVVPGELESVSDGDMAGKLSLTSVYDSVDWGKYQSYPEWAHRFVEWLYWIAQVEQGGLIFDEESPIQMALQYEFVWLKWDAEDALGGVGIGRF